MSFPSLEKCLEQVSNRYLLVVLAAKRSRQLNRGAQPQVETKRRKRTRVALEEIAGKVQLKKPDEADKTPPPRPEPAGLREACDGAGRPGADPRRHGQHRRLQGGLPAARAPARGGARHRRDDRARARVRRRRSPSGRSPAGPS